MEHTMSHSHIESPETESTLKTYKPLILVAAFIVGVTALVEMRAESFYAMRAMNNFMAGFFLFFSFFKFLNLEGFADAFSTYDVIGKRSRAYALAYPFIELTLGIVFLLGLFPFAANALTAVLMAVGNYGVWKVLQRKGTIQCACLGTIFNLPMTKITLFENTLMMLMAIWSLAMEVVMSSV